MKMKGSKKLAMLLVIPAFLAVGGAAAFFYVISNATDPEVTRDINNHFLALNTQESFVHADRSFASEERSQPEYVLFSTHRNHRPPAASWSKTETPQKKIKQSSRKNGFSPVTVKPGITQIAFDTFFIEASAMNDARANLRKYIGSALAELVEDKNGPVGFRLKNINKKSYLYAVGVRNNDVLVAINGHALNSIEHVTMAIASFKNANQFRLDLLRNNEKKSLYYKVVK